MSALAYKVLAEFRFDVAHAIAGSDAVQSRLGAISGAAQNAQMHIARLGVGIAATFGVGLSGGLYFLVNAVKASDKFNQSQRNLANIFRVNKQIFGDAGITFEQAMGRSAKVMENIRKAAIEYALDPEELLNQTKLIAPMLLSHGLDGPDLKNSTDISRGLLKSAPTLGIDPGMLGGQLINMVGGRTDMNSTLFQRLMSETSQFKDAGIKDAKGYNALGDVKRIELLRSSLLEFGKDAQVLSGNVESLSGQFRLLNSMIQGQFSIFRSIGDQLSKPIIEALNIVNDYLKGHGKEIIDTFSRILGTVRLDVKSLYIQLKQWQQLQASAQSASKTLSFIGIFHGLKYVLGMLGVTFGSVWSMFKAIPGMFSRYLLPIITTLTPILLKFAGYVMKAIVGPFIALTWIFQILAKAAAIADIKNLAWFGENLPHVMKLFESLKNAFDVILAPITIFSDLMSELLSWFFQVDLVGGVFISFFEKLVKIFQFIGFVVMNLMAAFAALGAVIGEMLVAIKTGDFTSLAGKMMNGMGDAIDDIYKQYSPKLLDADTKKWQEMNDSSVNSKTNVNIGKVEINNAFKEQMEPDRIAFTMQSQLLKAARNPQQSAGRMANRAGLGV